MKPQLTMKGRVSILYYIESIIIVVSKIKIDRLIWQIQNLI